MNILLASCLWAYGEAEKLRTYASTTDSGHAHKISSLLPELRFPGWPVLLAQQTTRTTAISASARLLVSSSVPKAPQLLAKEYAPQMVLLHSEADYLAVLISTCPRNLSQMGAWQWLIPSLLRIPSERNVTYHRSGFEFYYRLAKERRWFVGTASPIASSFVLLLLFEALSWPILRAGGNASRTSLAGRGWPHKSDGGDAWTHTSGQERHLYWTLQVRTKSMSTILSLHPTSMLYNYAGVRLSACPRSLAYMKRMVVSTHGELVGIFLRN